MPAPNRQLPDLGKDGNPRKPANDEEARRAGLQRVVRTSDGSVIYAHSIDVPELTAGGEYRWEHWTDTPPAAGGS